VQSGSVRVDSCDEQELVQWVMCSRVRVSCRLCVQHADSMSSRDVQPGGSWGVYELHCRSVWILRYVVVSVVLGVVQWGLLRECVWVAISDVLGCVSSGVRVSSGVHQRHREHVSCRAVQRPGICKLQSLSSELAGSCLSVGVWEKEGVWWCGCVYVDVWVGADGNLVVCDLAVTRNVSR